tara:strand:+ start:1174 stop:3987 length:2814 start_codon:yes stop_codon:yes gene_type:complete
MYNMEINGADGVIGAVIALLWVFVLMGAVTVTFAANRREETIRTRIGIEIETLRTNHAESAPNESITHWLDKMKSVHGEKFVASYLKSKVQSESEWRKTRKSRREAVMATLPLAYKDANFDVVTERWSQGQTNYSTKVITDGSISPSHLGFEIVSHPLVDGKHHPWLAVIGKLLRPITRINNTCGLHIHVGLRDPDTRFGQTSRVTGETQMERATAMATAGKVLWAYTYFNAAFNQLVSGSRHNHQYCQQSSIIQRWPSAANYKQQINKTHWSHENFDAAMLLTQLPQPEGRSVEWAYVDDAFPEMGVYVHEYRMVVGEELHHNFYSHGANQGRYYHVNIDPLLGRGPYGTVEFRQHQGTTNPTKIGKWADLLHQFVCRCHDDVNFDGIESYDQTLDGLWAFMDYPVDHHIRDYYTKRAVILSGSTLIRACKECGSDRCVHYECSVNDVSVDEDSVQFFVNQSREYACNDCHEIIGNEQDLERTYDGELQGWCNDCDNDVSVHVYEMGLLATFMFGLMVAAPVIGALALIVGCGIGAIHSGTHKFTGNLPFKGATKRFKTMFGALAVRGGQASGFAWDNGKGVYYLKSPTSSTYLKNRADQYLTKDTKWTMGHTRYATHGKNNAENAHPHFSEHVTLVHNGVVHNHDDVYKALKVEPYGPVDTQAVVACLEVGGIEEVVKHCEGSMSLIWHDKRDPQGTIKFWSNGGNPLCFGRLDNAVDGMVVVCSTMDILKKSMGKRLKSSWSCTIGREYTINPDGTLTTEDIAGSEATSYTSYDWRTYDSLYGSGKSKSSKKRNINVKAKGNADNCAVDFEFVEDEGTGPIGHDVYVQAYNFDDDAINSAVNEAWSIQTIDGFQPVDDKWHGYDAVYHNGIRPDKSTYHLPNYHQGEAFDPMYNTDQMVALMEGMFDPRTYYDPMEDYYESILNLQADKSFNYD